VGTGTMSSVLVITSTHVSSGYVTVSQKWRFRLELVALLLMVQTFLLNLVLVFLGATGGSSQGHVVLAFNVTQAAALVLIIAKSAHYWTRGAGREQLKPSTEVPEDPVTITVVTNKPRAHIRFWFFFIQKFLVLFQALSVFIIQEEEIMFQLAISTTILTAITAVLTYFYSTDMFILIPLIVVYFRINRLYPHKMTVSASSLVRNSEVTPGHAQTPPTGAEDPPPSYSQAVTMRPHEAVNPMAMAHRGNMSSPAAPPAVDTAGATAAPTAVTTAGHTAVTTAGHTATLAEAYSAAPNSVTTA